MLGNKTHLSNAAAVPTTAEGRRQQCYKAKTKNNNLLVVACMYSLWKNGYTFSVGTRYIHSEINNEKRDQ